MKTNYDLKLLKEQKKILQECIENENKDFIDLLNAHDSLDTAEDLTKFLAALNDIKDRILVIEGILMSTTRRAGSIKRQLIVKKMFKDDSK